MFRPELNMSRLSYSMHRLGLPEFDAEALLECIKLLLRLDSAWVPDQGTEIPS